MSADSWYGWAAIGAAASLGAGIWAFRGGVLGVLANFAVGIGGGILGGALSHGPYPHHVLGGPAIPGIPAPAGPVHLFFAGVGAIAALLVLHTTWWLLKWRGRHAPAR